MLRATVAPTFPAPPTTVTLRFIRSPRFLDAGTVEHEQNQLGQLTSHDKKFFTEIVENPVEKVDENRIALQQSEEISRLHHRGALDASVTNRRIIL
jgi:hypothetical protein